MSSEAGSVNPVVTAIISGTAPRPAQLAASRGILPLPQADLLEVLVHLARGDDAELRENARRAIAEQDAAGLEQVIRAANTSPNVLAYFVEDVSLPAGLHEAILANPRTPADAISRFARTTQNGSLLELISLNQQLLIQNPSVIEAIVANPHRTADAERRATEVRREFFEKERGAKQIADELRARGHEAAAEFMDSAESDISAEDAILLAQHIEVMDRETDDSWLALEFIEEIYEETEDQRKATVEKIISELSSEEDEIPGERISMINRIMHMSVKDRVKLGMKGDREARNILIRDPNRLVSAAVVNNPRITEQEVELIAAMRSVNEDVLRLIAMNRNWARVYNIMHALAKNPRTPIANTMNILTRLQQRDLVAMTKNRNVPDAVRRQATRLIGMRSGKG
jgi:hypothetical protein